MAVFPGPRELGRSIVVAPGIAAPDHWSSEPPIVVDSETTGDPIRLAALVDTLHRVWMARDPRVVVLALSDDELRAPQVETRSSWEVGPGFTFLRERLHFLVWANSWDGRGPEPVWWWGVKAQRLGATPGAGTDVRLPDGTQVFIDGGPRSAVAGVGHPIVHAESIDAGKLTVSGKTSDGAVVSLTADQQAAVVDPANAVRLIAPAGSGKTRTLIARIRHLVDHRSCDPEAITALAYNNRAAAEMRTRLGRAGVEVRTLHALGWEILRQTRGDVRLLDERDQRRILEPMVEVPRRPNTDIVGPYLEALGEVRIGLRHPDEVEAARDDVPGFAHLFGRYRDVLERRLLADHDEQISGAIHALLVDPDLRRRRQARCRVMLVDEFQDLTPAYLLLVRLLSSPGLQVFGVGDDDQTIYGYAGASPDYLIDYERLFPAASAHALGINFRSPVPVVTAASTLLAHNERRVAKSIEPGPDARPDAEGLQVVTLGGDEMAPEVAARIAGWMSAGVSESDVAILSRVNSALLPVHAACAEVGIPVQSPVGPGLLDRTVARAVLAWLRLGLHPEDMDRADLLEAVRRPSRGISGLARELLANRRRWELGQARSAGSDLEGRQRERWDRWCDDLELVADGAVTGDSRRILDVLTDRIGLRRAAGALDAGRARADRAGQSDDLVALRRCSALHPDAPSFEPWLRAVVNQPDDPDGVLLTTVHRVKGMEWSRIVVFGADAGLMPHFLSDDVEEERRVFHVALTRGRDEVVVVADRTMPSRFLAEMTEAPASRLPAARAFRPADGVAVSLGDVVTVSGGFNGTVVETDGEGIVVALDPGPGRLTVRWGDRVRASDASGPLVPDRAGPPDADRDLVDALKAWRSRQASERGLPAYVILHDSTIDELARRRPTDEEGLVAVKGIGPAKVEEYGDDILAIVGA